MCVHFGVEVARKQSNTAFPIKSASLNAVGCFLHFLIWYEPRMCGARAFENISLVRTIAHASRQTRHRMSHRSSPSHHVHGQHHHNHHHHIRDIIIITIIISSSFTSEFLIAVVDSSSSSLSIMWPRDWFRIVCGATPSVIMSSFFIWIADLPDEIRVRTRSRADPIDRGVERVRPNVLANTAEVGRLLHEHNAVCALEGPSCVHCLAEVEPGFIYDDLTDLSPVSKLQRDFFASLSGGSCNTGHLYFLRVLNAIALKDLPQLPSLKGSGTFAIQLPRWFVTRVLSGIGEEDTVPDWLRNVDISGQQCCLRVARQFATLVAAGVRVTA